METRGVVPQLAIPSERNIKAEGNNRSLIHKDKENPQWNNNFMLSIPKDRDDRTHRICDSASQLMGEAESALRKHVSEMSFREEWCSGHRSQDMDVRGELASIYFGTSPQRSPVKKSNPIPRTCNVVCPQPRYIDPTVPFKKMFMPEEGSWSNWDARSLLVDTPPAR